MADGPAGKVLSHFLRQFFLKFALTSGTAHVDYMF